MSNLPIKPVTVPGQPTALGSADATQSKEATTSDIPSSTSGDALVVSVASTAPRGVATQNPTKELEIFVKDLFSGDDALSAHGKLDPARVYSILNDED